MVLCLALRFKRQGFAVARLSAGGKSAPLAALPLHIIYFNQVLVLTVTNECFTAAACMKRMTDQRLMFMTALTSQLFDIHSQIS